MPGNAPSPSSFSHQPTVAHIQQLCCRGLACDRKRSSQAPSASGTSVGVMVVDHSLQLQKGSNPLKLRPARMNFGTGLSHPMTHLPASGRNRPMHVAQVLPSSHQCHLRHLSKHPDQATAIFQARHRFGSKGSISSQGRVDFDSAQLLQKFLGLVRLCQLLHLSEGQRSKRFHAWARVCFSQGALSGAYCHSSVDVGFSRTKRMFFLAA